VTLSQQLWGIVNKIFHRKMLHSSHWQFISQILKTSARKNSARFLSTKMTIDNGKVDEAALVCGGRLPCPCCSHTGVQFIWKKIIPCGLM